MWVEMQKTGFVYFQVMKYQKMGSATNEYFTIIPNIGNHSAYFMDSNLKNSNKTFILGKIKNSKFVSNKLEYKKENYGELTATQLNEIFDQETFKKVKEKKKSRTI